MKKSIFLFFAAILYATSALGIGAKQCYVYFDNSTWNATNVKFVFWQDKGSSNFYIKTKLMTTLSNTQLKYVQTDDCSSWNPPIAYFNFLEVANTSDWGDQALTWSNFQSWAQTKYTAKQNNWDFNGGYQLFTGAQTTKNKNVSGSYNSSYGGLLDRKHTLKVMVSTDGGNTYTQAATSPAKVSLSSYKMSSKTSCGTATSAEITLNSSTTSQEVTATYTANTTLRAENIAAGYTFAGWYDATNGKMISTSATPGTWNPKDGITLEARFNKEEAHTVDISYMCEGEEIQIDGAPATATVGVSTNSSIIAPKVIGYKFVDWTLGDGVQTADELTSETISITTKNSGSYTLTANYEKLEVVYFVNNSKWSNVKIYGWGGNAPAEEGINKWAGVGLTKTSEKIGNYDIYVFDATTDFVKQIIFNNGNGGDDNQTKNYVWADGNYYWHGNANDFAGKTKDEAVKYFTIPFVVGSSEGLFGTTWDITNTANDMQLVDGIYTLVKNNISLPDGTIEYKVVIGHDSWDPSYGKDGNNATLTISKSGKYDVTFTYNPTTHEVNATAELKNEEVIVPTVAMHGTFFGDWNNTENFTIADNKATATLTLLIEKGIYEFGMRIGGSGNWTANGAAFTEADNEKVITGSGDKMSFTANKDGNYTFTWTYETNTLTIAYPAVETIIPRTYTVAGNNRAAFGEEWKPEKTENDMVLQVDGTYKWTKSEIALKKNTEIDFKVVKNHSWDEGSWPSEAWKINTIDKDGYYTITIVFDAITKNITATAEWTGEAPFKDFSNQSATLYFHPSTNWTADHAEFAAYFYNEGFGADAEPKWVNMTDNNTDGVYEVDNSKEHEYVIICRMNPARTETRWNNDDDNKDDAAKAKKPVWNQISTGITIPNTAGDLNTCCAVWENLMGDIATDKCTWVVPTPLTDANWATIVNTYKDKTINLIVERTFVSGQNHTLCLPFNLPTNWLGENSKAYQLSSIVSNSATELELKATEHTTMLAGQPYIVNATKGNNDYDHLIVSNVTVTNATAGANVVTGGGFKATLQAVTATNGTTDGSTEYYIGATTGNLHKDATNKLGLRALVVLTKTDGTAVQGVRARVAFGENVETGIDNIITTDTPIKVIQNGQLIIIREGVKYNVQGQKL